MISAAGTLCTGDKVVSRHRGDDRAALGGRSSRHCVTVVADLVAMQNSCEKLLR
jgi:hypothetical protein